MSKIEELLAEVQEIFPKSKIEQEDMGEDFCFEYGYDWVSNLVDYINLGYEDLVIEAKEDGLLVLGKVNECPDGYDDWLFVICQSKEKSPIIAVLKTIKMCND